MKKVFLTAAMLVASASLAIAAPFESVDTAKGKVLADDHGMTLYTFKNDKMGMSECYDACAKNWPPYLSAKGAKAPKGYSMVKRKDGSEQWAKDGMPLYRWQGDKKKGDMTGDGFKGLWSAAKP